MKFGHLRLWSAVTLCVGLIPEAFAQDLKLGAFFNDHAVLQLEQARFAAAEPNAAMVVTADAQEQHTLHPLKKSLIARRLAAFAMDRCYGAGNPQADAARPVACRSEGNRLMVEFANARAFYSVGSVIGLELAGRDGVFKPAKIATPIAFSPTGDAFRDGNRLTFEANGVDSPIRLRYLCKDTGYGSNLYSDDAMSVGPFEIALPETDAAFSD